jgi:hypothetical protein
MPLTSRAALRCRSAHLGRCPSPHAAARTARSASLDGRPEGVRTAFGSGSRRAIHRGGGEDYRRVFNYRYYRGAAKPLELLNLIGTTGTVYA